MLNLNYSDVIPMVIETSNRGERAYDIFSLLLRERIIFVGTAINDQIANLTVAQLLYLNREDAEREIHMYINSPGGQIYSGLAIYDTMKSLHCDINTYCIGQAASMGSLLLAAGTKGKRYMLPNSRAMIHQPWGGIGGTSADIAVQAKEIIYMKHRLATILSECCDQTLDKILIDTERDFFMSAEDAVAYGLADSVLKTEKDEKQEGERK